MKHWNLYLNSFLLGYLIMALSHCCTINLNGDDNRFEPKHKGVDPVLKPYVDDYFALGKLKKLEFSGKVTVGFEKIEIKDKAAIGVCYSGTTWREVVVDKDFWNHSTALSKQTLIRHELTHCYCGRPHDWAKGKEYPESDSVPVKTPEDIDKLIRVVNEGKYEDDGCPLSIMHPYLLSDPCVRAHYAAYTEEMFDRCEAY